MRAAFINIGDNLRPQLQEVVELHLEPHDAQFLSQDGACRLQLRRLLKSDLPAGTKLHGATALLSLRDETGRVTTVFTVRADRTRVRNTRAGVTHAINCIERLNPPLARELRAIAATQTKWGEPGEEPASIFD